MSATPAPRVRFPALQHRDFRTLWTGMLLASGTTAFQYYAQIWLVYSLTESALVLGVLGATRGVAMLTFGLYGGALADRMDRRRLLMITSIATMLVNATLGTMAVTGTIVLWQVFVLIFIAAATQSIDAPVRQALIPELVPREHISNAVALTMAAQMGTFALTPALAGFVIDALGPGGAYAVSVGGNVIVIATLALLHYRGAATEARRTSVVSNIRHGVRYVRGDGLVLRIILIMLTMGAFGSAIFNGLIAKWASEILDLRPGQYGVIASMWGLGTLIISYALASTNLLDHRGRIFIISSIGFGLSFVAFGFARWLPLVGFAYLLNGMAMAGSNVSSISIVQSIVPNDVRGRVMSLYGLNQSVAQLNGITLGAVAQVMGMAFLLPATTIVCTVVVVALVLTSPGLRRIDAAPVAAEPAAPPEAAGGA
ncbi:MAG: MFS transporter [Chloroflexi bacterium]|nr:MFS transporter [Chloroflexota bacterium]